MIRWTFQVPSSNGFGFMVFWRFWGKGSLSQSISKWINDEGVCRTDPASQGLLKIGMSIIFHMPSCWVWYLCRDKVISVTVEWYIYIYIYLWRKMRMLSLQPKKCVIVIRLDGEVVFINSKQVDRTGPSTHILVTTRG